LRHTPQASINSRARSIAKVFGLSTRCHKIIFRAERPAQSFLKNSGLARIGCGVTTTHQVFANRWMWGDEAANRNAPSKIFGPDFALLLQRDLAATSTT
jgi:hypothetical protein